MDAAARATALSRLNSQPPNQTAGTLLPEEWQDPDQLNILQLALWGLEEQGLKLTGIEPEDLEAAVLDLQERDPDEAMEIIDGMLTPDALVGKTAAQAASMVLQAVRDPLLAK